MNFLLRGQVQNQVTIIHLREKILRMIQSGYYLMILACQK